MRKLGIFAGSLAVAALMACASGGASTGAPGGPYGAETSEQAVEQFVTAARMKDYQTMTRLFGTGEGPASERIGRAEIEQRMFVLAAVMEHRSHTVRSTTFSEGSDKLRYMVDMVGTRSGDVSVPVITVRYRDRWLVEQVITDPLTRR